MKFKLTATQMDTLGQMVAALAAYDYGNDYEDLLLKAMMQRLHEDLQIKAIRHQREYKMNWHPERALAFAAAAQVLGLGHTSHAGAILHKLKTSVDQLIVNSQ
jgi:hypothetical protein